MASNYGFDRASKERLLSSRRGDFGFFEEPDDDNNNNGSILDRISQKWEDLQEFMVKMFEMGRSDPRQVIFAAKSGLALALVSVLIFFEKFLTYLHKYSIWAILTAIVVFEFSVGATLSKGFNRALGTLSAAVLGLGIAQLSVWAGAWHELVVVVSIFTTGTITSYVKLYPSMKAYEYGFRVFMLTFSIVLVAGTSHFYRAAVCRLLLVGVGASVVLIVNICIYPIWSGEDLHKLVVKNFRGVATSLEGCVRSYLENVEYERIPSKILVYQATDDPIYTGYRAAISSTGEEDALLGFAIWEPPHGRYRMFRYPWGQFVKVSGALRHCAFMVMGMHGCILSEIQAAAELRYIFRNEIQRVGIEGAKVLRELGNKLEKLERLSPDFDLLEKVHEAAEELQMLIDQKSYHLVDSEKWAAAIRPKEFEDPEHVQEVKAEETHMHKMGSSTAALRRSLTFKNPDRPITNISVNPEEETHMHTMRSSTAALKRSLTFKNPDRPITNMSVNPKDMHTMGSSAAALKRSLTFKNPARPITNMSVNPGEESHMHTMGSSAAALKRSLTFKNPDRPITNMSVNSSFVNWDSSEDILKQQLQWPSRLSVLGDVILNDREVRTYESASALSLANFTSSLIEFVARLQNLVNSYQELSEKARFSEPGNVLEKPEDVGLGTRLLKCIGLKN